MNESRIELLEALGFAWVLGKDWKEKRKEAVESSKVVTTTPLSEAYTTIYDNKSVGSGTVASLKESAFNAENDTVEKSNADGSFSDQHDDNDNTLLSSDDESSRKFSPEPEDEVVHQLAKRKRISEDSDSFKDQKRSFSSDEKKKKKIPRVEVDGRTLSHVLFVANPGEYDSDVSSRTSDEDSDDDDLSPPSRQERNKSKSRNRYNTDKHWKKRFEDISEFKAINGHANVPFQYPANKSLSYWVSNQRQKYKQFVKEQRTTLTKERIDALESIGFKFNIRDIDDDIAMRNSSVSATAANERISKDISTTCNQTKSMWDVRMNEMKEYKRRYGDCLVPAIYLSKKQLGTWVINQR